MFCTRRFATAAIILVIAISCGAQTRKSRKPSIPVSRVQVLRVEPRPVLVRRTTPLKLVMPYPVSLSASVIGQTIEWQVSEDVMGDGAPVIPKGAIATATVTTIFNSGNHPRLSMALDTVHLPTGETASIAADVNGNRYLNFNTTLTNDAVVPEGAEITAYLSEDLALRPAQQTHAAPAVQLTPEENRVVLHGATPVVLQFARKVTSEYAEADDRISFRVVEPVRVGELIAIKKGAIAWGTVTEAQTSRNYGRRGKLFIRLDFVQLADGDRAYLNAVMSAEGRGKAAETWGIMPINVVVGGVLAGTTDGNDVAIAQGTEITAYVKDDVVLDGSKLRKQ